MNRDEYNANDFKDLVFVAYSLVVIDETTGERFYPDNSMELLKSFGLNHKYEPFLVKTTPDRNGFLKIYNEFKAYRDRCPFLMDGIVIKFPENKRSKLGENSHEPKWSVAIKYPPSVVSTYIEDVEWNLGKNGEFTPVALLKPVELDGVVVKRASMHNLGYIIKNKVYPGTKVAIAKKGEIIPQIVGILEKSPDESEYIKYVEEFISKNN